MKTIYEMDLSRSLDKEMGLWNNSQKMTITLENIIFMYGTM